MRLASLYIRAIEVLFFVYDISNVGRRRSAICNKSPDGVPASGIFCKTVPDQEEEKDGITR